MKEFSLVEKETIEYLLPIWKKMLDHNKTKINSLEIANNNISSRITKWEKFLNDKTSI